MFFERIQKKKVPGYEEFEYFFSLDNCNDQHRLRSVRFSSESNERLIKSLMDETHIIDLSDPISIERRYGLKYRECFALLSVLVREFSADLNIKSVKWNHPDLIIKMK